MPRSRLSPCVPWLLLALTAFSLRAADSSTLRFAFGTASTAAGTTVAPDTTFTTTRGYGFEPGSTLTATPAAVESTQPFYLSAAVPTEGN